MPPDGRSRPLQVHGTAARVSAGAENRMLAKKRTAVAMQGIGSDGATKPGLLPSMRNPSTCRVLRRAWTAGRLAGSLRFPPWPRILPTGSSLSIRNPAPPSEPPSERDQFHLIRLRSGQPPRPNVRPGPIPVDFPWATIALIRNVRMAPIAPKRNLWWPAMTIRAMRWLHLGNCSGGVSLRLAGGVSGLVDGRHAATHVALYRRARHRSVRAKHAAIAREGLEPFAAPFAVIEELAGIGRHRLDSLMAAFRASQGGLKLHIGHREQGSSVT